MGRIDTHQSSKLTFAEGAVAATPASALVHLYAKSDGLLYSKDDAGAETLVSGSAADILDIPTAETDDTLVLAPDGVGGVEFRAEAGGGDVATDAIWDAAGDLAVGSGANTAAKLGIGAAGGALSVYNGAVIWNSGTSFPATPDAGDRYWRTDLAMEFCYDGTRWLSASTFSLGSTVAGLTDDARHYLPISHAFKAWLVSWDILAYLTGSATWVVTLEQQDTEGDSTVLDTQSTASHSANQFYAYTKTLGVEVDATAAHGANLPRGLSVLYDEQSGSAGFYGGITVVYRLIAT